jgi:NhaP-type Na+/H+ or K+/H+ antiporter
MTAALILNIAFSIVVFTVIVGMLTWSIVTQRGSRVTGLARIDRHRQPAIARRTAHGAAVVTET